MKKILTWHVHGNYLYYLTQLKPVDFFIPVKEDGESGYQALGDSFDWGNNVHQVPAEKVKELKLDLILFQSNYPSNKIYLQDQFKILSKEQQTLPKIYLEHDPPREYPTDTKHITYNTNTLLVHVTSFNSLMWDSGHSAVRVVEHGVKVLKTSYIGDLPKGVVVINNLDKRGRRLGLDIFERVRKYVPLDLIGINSETLGGLGEVSHNKLPEVLSHYRFIFNPSRYTSLGLIICEAMMIGMPVVSLATTEMVMVVEDKVSGYLDTNLDKLIVKMELLIKNRKLAEYLGQSAYSYAQKRFNIKRFTNNWEKVISDKIRESEDQNSDLLLYRNTDEAAYET